MTSRFSIIRRRWIGADGGSVDRYGSLGRGRGVREGWSGPWWWWIRYRRWWIGADGADGSGFGGGLGRKRSERGVECSMVVVDSVPVVVAGSEGLGLG
ncbi:hypothetical protein Acr_02g0008480 [Actinidia rufa]|uniref:Uncharacterized protein n=1 Tax=Actinidia rufa TaxID=165716 RepID=A0A7J0E832_9ERIC|nr:hypothetical protein Acr_02g0008480 [Actinidia rufa]